MTAPTHTDEARREAAAAGARLGQHLQRRGWMMGCAESCTGGLVAATLTDIPGASGWFDRGFVTYSNAAKQRHLGVAEATLAQWGAVSEQTAAEMASGVLATDAGLRLAVSTTGIAGPGGATPGKPVGMVCFGLAWRDEAGRVNVQATTHHFDGDRAQVRWASVAFVLDWAAAHTAQTTAA